ncbi:MAG: SDR family NAD(P)-dependent oxidoreductase [Actinomycetota bacterium]|nr:SDR family NAD(P)-dependent oxidoreductase [Actinomycetota bacterium]
MLSRAIVTGTNRGTGHAIASSLADGGFRVASLNRTCTGEPWLGEIRCDLHDSAAVDAAAQSALEELGGVDVVVANAAVRRYAPVTEMTDADWDDSLEVNLSSVFRLVRRVLPALRESHGDLVLVSSQAAREPFEGGAAYCASKAALTAFAEVVRMETREDGVRTIVLTPGAIRNRPKGDGDARKIEPESIARLLLDLLRQPSDVLVANVDIRPARQTAGPARGIERLQSF